MSERLTDDEIRHLLDACATYPAGDDTGPAPLRVGEAVYVLGEVLMLRRVRDAAITVGDEMSAEVAALRARVAELEADLMAAHGDPDDHGADCDTCGHWTHAPIQGQCRACRYDEDPDDDLTDGGCDE